MIALRQGRFLPIVEEPVGVSFNAILNHLSFLTVTCYLRQMTQGYALAFYDVIDLYSSWPPPSIGFVHDTQHNNFRSSFILHIKCPNSRTFLLFTAVAIPSSIWTCYLITRSVTRLGQREHRMLFQMSLLQPPFHVIKLRRHSNSLTFSNCFYPLSHHYLFRINLKSRCHSLRTNDLFSLLYRSSRTHTTDCLHEYYRLFTLYPCFHDTF